MKTWRSYGGNYKFNTILSLLLFLWRPNRATFRNYTTGSLVTMSARSSIACARVKYFATRDDRPVISPRDHLHTNEHAGETSLFPFDLFIIPFSRGHGVVDRAAPEDGTMEAGRVVDTLPNSVAIFTDRRQFISVAV